MKLTPELKAEIERTNKELAALREQVHAVTDILYDQVKQYIYVLDEDLDVDFLKEVQDELDGSFVEFEISRRLRMYYKNKNS